MKILIEGCVKSYVSGVIDIDNEKVAGMTEEEKLQYIDSKVTEWENDQTYRYDGDECDDISYEIEE